MKKFKDSGSRLTLQILIGLVAGILFGILLNVIEFTELTSWIDKNILRVGGQLFLAALKLLVVPVVLVSLVCGVASLKDLKQMGRIGGKTFLWYLLTTAMAIGLALIVSLITGPGQGFDLISKATYNASEAPSVADTIVSFMPNNAIKAMADSNMLQIIVLATLFGIAISMAGESGRRIESLFKDLNEVIMKFVTIIMAFAPVGVFCLIAQVFIAQGFGAIAPLAKYFFTVLVVLVVHATLTYTFILKGVGGLNLRAFYRKFRKVMVFAFSTSSSNATLPVCMEVTEKELGVSNSVASFTLPLGATINMDGTAIMQGVATVFIAQAYGVDIGLQGYLTVIGMTTLASIGTAGVPGVGLVTLAMVLRQVNLPVEGIGLIIGIDRLLDMSRTVVNVTGDAVITCVVAKSEGELNEKIYLTSTESILAKK